ncbi:hypothetical protein [Okeania sp.]|uniref:hypothetical protein n=1 Tax=Okeania sp. TaxID=3100323 RepID=UPI002B4B0869|nr:hypothetical protein [Okeania sp.]MEB3342872.1 hypothetical protein [Okeania sp.]
MFILNREEEEGGRRKEEEGRRKEEGGRRKEEGGRRKEEGGRSFKRRKKPYMYGGRYFSNFYTNDIIGEK